MPNFESINCFAIFELRAPLLVYIKCSQHLKICQCFIPENYESIKCSVTIDLSRSLLFCLQLRYIFCQIKNFSEFEEAYVSYVFGHSIQKLRHLYTTLLERALWRTGCVSYLRRQDNGLMFNFSLVFWSKAIKPRLPSPTSWHLSNTTLSKWSHLCSFMFSFMVEIVRRRSTSDCWRKFQSDIWIILEL